MTTITTRSGKGSPLTNDEVDANFTNLNTDKVETSGDSMTGNLSFGDNVTRLSLVLAQTYRFIMMVATQRQALTLNCFYTAEQPNTTGWPPPNTMQTTLLK
jgi:hypothetical protein